MIVSNIMMGLGNQMFQYAAGRSLSLHLKVPLKLYTHSYSRYHLRKYELENYFDTHTPHKKKRLWEFSLPLKDFQILFCTFINTSQHVHKSLLSQCYSLQF